MTNSARKDATRPPSPQQLICGDHVVGFVSVDSCDNFSTLGSFRAGPDYEGYGHLFDDLRTRQQQMDQYLANDDDDDKYDLASEEWNDALDRINDLRLSLRSSDGSDLQPIRDFQIDENDRVEFKFKH
jgi:hypothetical protein